MARTQKTNYSQTVSQAGGVDEYKDPIEIANDRMQSASDIYIDADDVFKRPGKLRWGSGKALTQLRLLPKTAKAWFERY